MDYLPIFMDLRDRRCLIVGGGEVAARKTDLLLEAGAAVQAVAPALGDGMQALADAGRIVYRNGTFQESDLDGAQLVIAASDDRAANARVAALADGRGVPVNVVDDPDLCRFIMPAIVDRSPVLAAVSTGGTSPVLARLMRGRLEALIPAEFGRLAALAGEFRTQVRARISDASGRRKFWEQILGGPVAEMIYSGRDKEARESLVKALDSYGDGGDGIGEVYLVGAGPGDPDMLTFRALRLMQQADVVVHDRLVSRRVLDLTRRDASRIYAGKKRASHALPQESINALLVRLAREGKRVLRLKGGDPFIFGRGGEEIETLAGRDPLSSRPRNHRRGRLRRLRRHPSDTPGSCSELRVRYRSSAGRHGVPGLGALDSAATDHRRLHGAGGTAGHLPRAHGPRHGAGHAGRSCRARYHCQSTGIHGDGREPPRDSVRSRRSRADPDYHRQCRATSRQIRLVREHDGTGSEARPALPDSPSRRLTGRITFRGKSFSLADGAGRRAAFLFPCPVLLPLPAKYR